MWCGADIGASVQTGRRALLRLAALAAVAAVLTGCAGKSESPTKPRKSRVDAVTLVMAPHVNDNWPVAVQLVRVDDANLISDLLAIESSAWFEGESEKFRNANPNVLLETWEVVPGTVVGPVSIWSRRRLGAVLFCDLRGRMPQRVERSGAIVVRIEDDGCQVVAPPPRRRWPATAEEWLRLYT